MKPESGPQVTDSEASSSARDRVRASVIESAGRLFAQRGIHAVTVRQIAQDAGVSHTLVHRYFGTKKAVVDAVLTEHSAPVAAALQSSQIGEMLANAVEALIERPGGMRTLAAGLLEGHPLALAEDRMQLSMRFSELLSQAVSEDEARLPDGVSPEMAAATGGAAIIGWAVARDFLLEIHGLDDLSQADLAAQLTELLKQMYGIEA